MGQPYLYALAALTLAAAAAVAVGLWLRHRAPRRLLRRRQAPTHPRLPVVLVHGLLGFDEFAVGRERYAYFRGVREALEKDGNRVSVARLEAAGSISARAEELARFVRAEGAGPVNLVAHSMGGLDARYAIARLGLGPSVGVLVTVGTPHQGTPLADLSTDLAAKLGIARALSVAGVSVEAFRDLTTASMARFNAEVASRTEVACASVVGLVRRKRRTNPLLLPSYLWLKSRWGDNDGVVPTSSQRWGQVLFEVEADHWAQIGWSRHFEAAVFYRNLLRELRSMGY
jgi:triacylglycerol lipase